MIYRSAGEGRTVRKLISIEYENRIFLNSITDRFLIIFTN